jgi:segregation and condensation protein A
MPAPTVPQVPLAATTAIPEGPIEVRFIEDRRPEVATVVRLGAFDGPLGLLLTLIESQKLDVLTVRLGDLAGAYLEALAVLPGERLPHLSTFVAVAAQLIVIKSRAILPRAPAASIGEEEAPDPEAELRRRLVLYRRYRDAAAILARRLDQPQALAHREATVAAAAGLLYARPPDDARFDAGLLVAALDRLRGLSPPLPVPPQQVARTITLSERADAIRAALAASPLVVLQELLAGTRDRILMAVTFLALLELVKRREVVAEQTEPWGPIRCRRLTPAERAAAGTPGDVAPTSAPIDETLEDFA